MANPGKRWIVKDRLGHPIYLTEERWAHIIDPLNHPEMADCEKQLQTTIRRGLRQQDSLNPRKYRYTHSFDNLPGEMNHVVAIVLFGFEINDKGETIQNNFITTAFLKHIRSRSGERKK